MKGRRQISVSDVILCTLEPCSQLVFLTPSLLDIKGNVELSIPDETNKEGKTNNMLLFTAVVLMLSFPLAIKFLISAKFILDYNIIQIST